MRELTVDFTGVTSIFGLYDTLNMNLRFPVKCGKNWDALWDCMCDYCDESHVTIVGLDTLPKEAMLQREIKGILEVFENVEKERKTFSYTVVNAGQGGE